MDKCVSFSSWTRENISPDLTLRPAAKPPSDEPGELFVRQRVVSPEDAQSGNAPGTFWAYRMYSIGAFHSLVMAGLPDRFPRLRMVFVEIASQWVPWTLKDLARRLPQQRGRTLPDNPLKANRRYVAGQSDDDLPYVLTYTGEDNMMMGTEYGHHDHRPISRACAI
jgi:predicted TIM-barrel fold metal-dependent hydrolase